MSNNAVDAYENGEKPLSKWTKADIIAELQEEGVSNDILQTSKKLSLAQLKEIFLYKSSWHHTSKMYNRTNFYSVNPDVSMSMITRYLNENAPKEHPKYHYYKVFYEKPCYAIGDSYKYLVYTAKGIIKVSNIRYEDILEIYEDIPDGTENIFNQLITEYENK